MLVGDCEECGCVFALDIDDEYKERPDGSLFCKCANCGRATTIKYGQLLTIGQFLQVSSKCRMVSYSKPQKKYILFYAPSREIKVDKKEAEKMYDEYLRTHKIPDTDIDKYL